MEREGVSQCQGLQGKNQEMARQENHEERIQPMRLGITFNSRVRLFGHRKLRSKWEGPYKVVNSSSHGAVTLQDDEGTLFKVNGQHLKKILEPNKESEDLDEIDFLCFPMNINFRP
jgi:hypothetical protein